MKDVYLIGCVSGHSDARKCKAKDLYTSDLFKKEFAYAKARTNSEDDIFIMSTKYHLIGSNDDVECYNQTFKNMNNEERMKWGKEVLKQLNEKFDMNDTRFVILAGNDYVTPLGIDKDVHDSEESNTKSNSIINHWIRPVRKGLQKEGKGSSIGYQLEWLGNNI